MSFSDSEACAIVISAYDLSKPRCACTYDVNEDGAEKAEERKKKTRQSSTRNKTQIAVINIVKQRIFINLTFRMLQHTFSKVTVMTLKIINFQNICRSQWDRKLAKTHPMHRLLKIRNCVLLTCQESLRGF